jgi:lipopolysaccharide/colanic/teichoic acid biosynthesis glycosyltransferase
VDLTRAFDLVASLVGLIVLAPLLLVVAALVRATSSGPALFTQERVGLGGRPFRIYKFRTMEQDAEASGGQLTIGADPRITRVGATLRRLKLDELPQLINVLRGDMSLVGPPPEVPRYVTRYDERQRAVLRVRPGITDPASIAFRDENALLARSADPEATYLEVVMPKKLEMNLAYLERRTVLSDVGVIMRTLTRLGRPGEA